MNVYRHRARDEMKVRLRKRAGRLLRPPAVIKSTIGHRITVRKKCRRVVVNDRHADLVKLQRNFTQPLIASDVAGGSLMRAIDIRSSTQSFFFRRDRIDNHSPHGRRVWCVQAADQKHNRVLEFADRFKTLEIRIAQQT